MCNSIESENESLKIEVKSLTSDSLKTKKTVAKQSRNAETELEETKERLTELEVDQESTEETLEVLKRRHDNLKDLVQELCSDIKYFALRNPGYYINYDFDDC
jgi:predicted nuclease with TOPRIM domain